MVERQPDLRYVVYHRNSSRSQAGTKKRKLWMNAHAIAQQATQDADGVEPLEIFAAVEQGKPSKLRPVFDEALDYARRHGAVLVAADLSRIHRPEAYHRRLNPNALSTAEELSLLLKRAMGVPLAVLLSIESTEEERLRRAIKRTGKAGRPRSYDMRTLLALVEYLIGPDGGRSDLSYPAIGERCGLTTTTIKRLVNKPVRVSDSELPLKDALGALAGLSVVERQQVLLPLLH